MSWNSKPTGSIHQVEHRFKESIKKADSVFLKIDSDLSQETVLRKIIGRIRKSGYAGSMSIAHFTATGKTYYWDIDSLK